MSGAAPRSPEAIYTSRAQQYDALAAADARRSLWFSRARIAAALIAAVAAASALAAATAWAVPVLLGSLALFVVLVIRHERVERRREAANVIAALNRDGLSRLARQWDALPTPWSVAGLDKHAFAPDLDLFGHASLVQILGPVRTPAGRRALARWLLDPAASDRAAIEARQAAVQELAPLIDFRQQFAGLARQVPETSPEVSRDELGRFVDWAEEPGWLESRPWVPALALGLGVVTTAGVLAWIAGWTTSPWWLVTATAGWCLRWFVHAPLEHAFGSASGEQGLRSWTALIRLVTDTRFAAPALAAAQGELVGRHGPAHGALRALEQLIALADLRLSTWLYLPIQTLTLWEIHVWWGIERWRARHGSDVRHWLSAVGHVEALASLASLGFDHPTWAYPTIVERATRVEGVQLGHPLLADAIRVPNDVTLGPRGRFLLITGSNMSGKSTLLRAIGLNIVLAHAGAPACAGRLRLPLLSLHTSMRVSDSLELGLSLFMASLVRLERIVRAARAASVERPACYLLDEVLQGTNSAERQIAVRTVVTHLLACHAVGAVTTHDLELARDATFAEPADSFHLQETLSGDGDAVAMTFDYRLRPGPAQSGNALQLLRMLGLGEADS